jgi:hypothetical protein
LPVAAEPVKAILSTSAPASAAPVRPSPVTTWSRSGMRSDWRATSPMSWPMSGVSSDGLNTTALPAARAYAIDPIGVKIG